MDLIAEMTGQVTESTNGILSDLRTVMLAMVLLQFIPLAVELITSVIHRGADSEDKDYDDYEKYYNRRQRQEKFANKYAADTKFVGPSER